MEHDHLTPVERIALTIYAHAGEDADVEWRTRYWLETRRPLREDDRRQADAVLEVALRAERPVSEVERERIRQQVIEECAVALEKYYQPITRPHEVALQLASLLRIGVAAALPSEPEERKP